jgi:hypothetical protein
MKTLTCALPMTLAFVAGCSTTLVDRSPAAPSSPISGADFAPASACAITGPVRTIAARARVLHGIEVAPSANKLVVRVATRANEALEMEMDPDSGAVTPVPASESSAKQAAKVCATHLENARTVPADAPFAIGTAHGKLSWSACGEDREQALWDLAEPSMNDVQVVSLGQHDGFAIAFRQGNALWLGTLDSEKKPIGSLAKVAERARLQGPTLAESEGSVLLAWAEQEAGSDQWSVGAVSLAKSGTPKASRVELPGGGIGGDAFQPALAGLEGGRFLLAWTEGNAWAHRVRAVTLDSNGAPVGRSLAVSDSVEGGWARLAVTPDGRGAVLFMTPSEDDFAAVATPIACSTKAPEESGTVAVERH